MDDYLLLELSSLKNSGDSDNDTRTRANRLMSLFNDDEPLRDWSFADSLREGGANLVRSLSPSNMEIERLQGLIGLDDEAFTKKARSQYSLFDDTYMLRRRPQEERDEELRRRIASMSEGRERVNAIADAIAPTPHAQPDTWYGKLGYGALKLAPDIAASIPQIMALGPLGFAGLSTVRGHNASTEQVYDNLRRQGFSPDEAYEKANALLPNIGDLALRGGVNFATMGLLNKTPMVAGASSPYSQVLKNIAMASGVSGVGAMGEQALTNYRTNTENDLAELAKTGLTAAGFTGAVGLGNALFNWRNLRELQRQYWENMKPVAVDWPPSGGDGSGNASPNRPNDPNPNGGGDLPQLEVLTPEKAARLQKQAEILAKYNLPPETDLWKAIDNGSIPDDTAFNILVDLGAKPDIARSLVEKTHQINDLMNRTNNLLRGTPKTKQSDTPRQPTEIIVPAKELRQDPRFTHPEPQGTQTTRPTAVKEPPASNPPSDMWSDPLKLERVPPKQPTQPAPRLMALGANEAYYNNDPYSDSGGDNSHPEQDIPEPHTSDNVPANINALGRQEHSNSWPDVPRLTEEEKARIKKKYPEKADDLIAYLENSSSDEELAQYGFKYGENGKYVPIEQGQQTEQPQPAPKAPDINALGRQPEQPRDVIAESMNDVAQKNSERDISRGDSNTLQQVQHRDKPKKPDTQQTEFIKYSGSTPPSERGEIDMQNRKLLDTLISGMPDNMQEIRNKLSALNVPTLIGILGYKDSDAKKEHYINKIINSMNFKRSHNPEYFDVAENKKYNIAQISSPVSINVGNNSYRLSPINGRLKVTKVTRNANGNEIEIDKGLYFYADALHAHDAFGRYIALNDEDIKLEEAIMQYLGGNADNVITQAQEVSQNAPEAPQPQKAPEPATPSRTVDTQSDSPIVRIAQQVKELLTGKWRKISNQDLLDLAAHEFGGTKGEGVFKHRQAYDAMEMGINMAVERAKISPASAKYAGNFESDIDKLLDILSRIPTQTNRDTEQVEYQQFSTPPTLAYLVNWLANISKNNTVLEPSAGTGNLAVFAHNAGAKLIMNDYSKSGLRADILDAFGWGKVYREDALYFGDILRNEVREGKRSESELPDRVIMNPPFSSAGKQGTANSNQNGFRHVEQALEALRDGGRLVAILGAGRDGTASSVKTWLRHIGKTYNVRALITSGGKAYQKYGTTFSNAIVVIDKTGATPKGSTKEFSFSGDFSNREEVRKLFDTLTDIHNDTQGDFVPFKTSSEASSIDDMLKRSITIRRSQYSQEEFEQFKKAGWNVVDDTTENNTQQKIATIKQFKEAFDNSDKGRSFVRIFKMRRYLDWPREVFDNMIMNLLKNSKIYVHPAEPTVLKPDEMQDSFRDEFGDMNGTMTWNEDSETDFNSHEFDIPFTPQTNTKHENTNSGNQDYSVEAFKKAFDGLNKGRIFVKIPDLRRKLAWPRDVFDNFLKELRDMEIIQLHTGDASLMTPDEVADCFVDENNFRKGSVTWEGFGNNDDYEEPDSGSNPTKPEPPKPKPKTDTNSAGKTATVTQEAGKLQNIPDNVDYEERQNIITSNWDILLKAKNEQQMRTLLDPLDEKTLYSMARRVAKTYTPIYDYLTYADEKNLPKLIEEIIEEAMKMKNRIIPRNARFKSGKLNIPGVGEFFVSYNNHGPLLEIFNANTKFTEATYDPEYNELKPHPKISVDFPTLKKAFLEHITDFYEVPESTKKQSKPEPVAQKTKPDKDISSLIEKVKSAKNEEEIRDIFNSVDRHTGNSILADIAGSLYSQTYHITSDINKTEFINRAVNAVMWTLHNVPSSDELENASLFSLKNIARGLGIDVDSLVGNEDDTTQNRAKLRMAIKRASPQGDKKGTTQETTKQDKPTEITPQKEHKRAENDAQSKPEKEVTSKSDISSITRKSSKEIREERKQQEDNSIQSSYSATVVTKGAKHHPADLVESTVMRSVALPDVKENPQISQSIIDEGRLSNAQMEAITLAINSFNHILPNGYRRGYFIGDGTGVGKGREISGIILDTLTRGAGKGKALWVSDKHSLIKDAVRDWQGIGQNPKDIFAQETFNAKQDIDKNKGILFTAYSHLASKFRIEQLKKWLGDSFDGIIVLDEAHNANNVLGEKPASRAINTLTFIRAFPKARVLYVSATGATELDNFAMLDRLGLWGYNGAPFESAQAFVNQLSKGGIAAMEVAARDLKAMGLFSARSLSMRAGPYGGKENVTFRTLEYQLNDEMKEIYDTLASIWQMIEQRMPAIMEARGYGAKDGKNIGRWKRYFWGAHQRFFNQIITAMQTDGVIRDMSKQLDAGNSIVIQLTNTMESSLDRAIQKGVNEEGEYDISPKDTLIQFVRDMFNPRAVEYVADEDGNEFVQDVFDSNGKPVLSQRVINMRDEMIKIIESINRFPDSPIDKILNFFGHENVAEITGRSKRPRTMIDKKTGKKTNLETGRTDKVKAGEIEDFNNGRRRILIFSEKGGTGASYHASNDVKNQQKRIHYLLQAGWRADKAIQGLGRSHRSNEAHKPEYVLVTTDIPGQKRFISTIARRLEQLGALSTGERRTTSGGLFSDSDNLESSYVTTALWKFFQKLKMPLESNAVPYPELNPEEVFRQLGFDMDKLEGIGVTDFLNRLLAMTVDTQKKVFSRFQQEINAVKEEYQANGIDIDAPTENVNALNIKILQEKRIFQSKEFETDTNYLQLEITRPMNPITWQEISGLIDAGVDFEFYTLQSGKIVAARKSPEKGFDPKTSQFFEQYTLIQPDRRKAEYGVRTEVLDNEDPKQRRQFTRIDAKTAQAIWNTQTDELPKTYTAIENLITGAMLPVWNLIEGHPKIWRVTTDDGREFLGRLIPEKQLQRVLRVCNVNYESNKKYDAETLKKDLDKRGMIATLLNKAKLKFSRVNGEKLLEIIPTDEWQARSLKRAGLISMIINSKERLFFPAGNDEMLNNYIKDNPLVGTPVQFDDADDILEEAADVINSSIDSSDSSHLHIIHPSFRGLFNWNQDDNPLVHKSPYASPNTEFEKRYQASKKTDEKKSILGHLKDFVLQVAKGRHDIPELAGDNWKKLFAVDDSLIDAQEIFREFKRERQANLHETEKILRAILLDIKKPDDFDLFERAMQLQDLNETRERDINARMPWGLNPDSLYDTDATDPLDEEYSRIMNHVSKNPRVQEAMQKADTLMNSLRNRLIKAAENLGMFDLRDRLNRKHYFRHLVLEYYNMQRSGQPHPIFKNPERRGYTAHRQGSDKDISSNWILAMGEVMIRMTDDIKILQTLAKLRKKYDIIETLKQQAFSDNKTRAVDEMMKDLKDVPEELRRGKAEEALEKKLHARQARAISRLFKLASEGDLPVGENHEWQEVAGRMADAGQLENLSREEQKNLSRYIGWLAGLKDKTDSRTAARSFLTGQKKQNSILKDILGEKYVDWKGAIPDDHTLWSPSDSRLVFSASTVPEYVLKLAMENIDDMLGVNVSDLGNAIATGGINQLWCIPAKLADALNNLGKSQPAGAFKKFMTSAMTGFKRWVTISPVNGRIVEYNWRNFFGDLEAVLQGNPGALYYFRQAAKELFNTMLKGGEATGLLAEFNKRGGGLTTEIMTELEHPERLKEFSRLFEQEKKHSILDIFRAYVEIMTRLTNFRESILRYASFLSFVRLIQENGGIPPFYGMSKPKEVLALKDNIYDMAFKLANENLGAYDQVSSNTQWLRDNNITSFLSWVEVNFTRSIQMYKNIWQGNSFLEYWIKKHGNDFINMFSGGGGDKLPPNNGNGGKGGGGGGNNEPPEPPNDGNDDDEFRKMFRKAAKKSGNVALRLAITLALASPFYFMAKIWNKLMGADENDPNLDGRNGVTIFLGRNPFTGDNIYMFDIGSAWDFMRTTGLHSIFGGDVRDLLDGRITFGQLITNMLDGPVTKLANNLNPYAKATAEAAFGKRMFPSALHPSPIRDKERFVAQSFGLDWYYDFLTDKPHKPFLDFASSIFNTAKQDQSAYFYIQGRKKQFQENVLGKYTDAFTMTRRGEALRNAKRAIDLGDKKSFRKFMREYFRAGGTEQGLKASARASDPLFGLNEEEQMRFIKWLPKEERKTLRRAMRYAEKIKAYLAPF